MSNPKRHHSTPCVILRNFADHEEKFFVFDKRRPLDGVVLDSIYNRFVKNHQNSLKMPDGTRDYSLEKHFSELESKVAPVLEKVLAHVRNRANPGLCATEKDTWDRFVIAQWTRMPKVRDPLCPPEQFEVLLKEVMDEFERDYRPITEEERQEHSRPDRVKFLRDRAVFDALQRDPDLSLRALENRGLGVAAIYDSKRSLVIGDNTVMKMTPAHTARLDDPEVEAWFPIAPDIALTPWGLRGEEKVIMMTDRQIRQFNEIL